MLKINRNIFWSNLFIDFLTSYGIKSACISPGYRSTPLTYVVSTNKLIRSFPIIDERSSAFFALGLSKSSNSPAFLISTSGTAVAELYPAIIEAYQSRIPLIVCTADRPARLRNTGSNQTINQKGIFDNHINFSADISLLEINKTNIKKFLSIISKGIQICILNNMGPVHFNFQFDKPFEPDAYTDIIPLSAVGYSLKILNNVIEKESKSHLFNKLPKFNVDKIDLITIGAGNFQNDFIKTLNRFSLKYNVPIFADITSGLRNNNLKLENLISNYDSLLKAPGIEKIFKPKNVLHFGRNITSSAMEDFLVKNKSKRIIVNEFGDRFDSTKKGRIIKSQPLDFIEFLSAKNIKEYSTNTLSTLLELNSEVEKIKPKVFSNRFTEIEVFNYLTKIFPDDSSVLLGNSLPIRDFDFYVSNSNKKLKILSNRGASGIDGLISTAAGICKNSKKPTYLILGDLSFYYDINALLTIKKFDTPLKIILINNNGGRIFEYLPISKYKNIFDKFFITPTNLNFRKIAEAFSIQHLLCNSLKELTRNINLLKKSKSSVILEVKVNNFLTNSVKKQFSQEVNKLITKKMS